MKGSAAGALVARDSADASRDVAPLVRPADAIPVDGTRLSFDEQVEVIAGHARRVFGLPPDATEPGAC